MKRIVLYNRAVAKLQSAQLLFEAAEKMNLHPQWLSEHGLFSAEYQNQLLYVFYSTSYLNTELSAYLAKNKFITRTILEQHNLPNIPFCLPQSQEEAQAFLKQHEKIVTKPTIGRRSQDITLVTSAVALKTIDLTQILFEKYIVGEEYRVLLLNNKPIALHKRLNTTPINDPEQVKVMSYPESEWNQKMLKIAQACMEALLLHFGCVDFIVDEDERIYILEVNSSPGLMSFQNPDEGPAIDIASIFLQETIKKTVGASEH